MVLTKQKVFNRLSVAVAILTFCGIALHDTKLDKFTAIAIAVPVVVAAYESAHLLHTLGGDSHTHVEKVSVEKTASRATGSMPHLQTRRDEDDKYKTSSKSKEGYHPFDNHTLPIFA